MSSLPPEAAAALFQLLTNLTSADNALRSSTEKSLNEDWIYGDSQHQELLLVGLAEQSIIGETNTIRSFAAVLFRRICTKQPNDNASLGRIIDCVSDGTLTQIKTVLLQGFVSDQSDDVRHKISDAIAELARPGTKSGDWPDLLSALMQGSKSPTAGIRESSFRILAAVPGIIGTNLLQSAIPVFAAGFQDDSEQVRISAVNAFTSFFQTLPKSTWPSLQPLLPNLLNVLTPLQSPSKSDDLSAVLESLIDLVAIAPKMFKPMFKTIIDFCIAVGKDKEMDCNARQTALELATTFADEAPTMCKKESTYAEQMVLQCLSMMTEIGEDDDEQASEWNNEDDVLNSDDQDELYSAAKQSLDRLALKLGGKVLLPPLFQWLPQMIGSQDWRQRHAALMALSNVAEGCRDVMMGELDKVLDMVLPCLQDAHSRVQWATCNAIGQMSTDFADYIQRTFSHRILPALISKLGNTSTPRVQAHAAAAMVNFSESATKEILEPYLDDLLTNLLELLKSPKRYVQEQVLTTIAIVADAAESKFSRYYDTLITLLFNVMKTDTGKEYRLLKAKAIECSTLIALAVGKEQFAPHCNEMVQIFASIQQSCVDDDDPCSSYLVHAWGRLCRIIGTDFLPYLNGVMPPLLVAAKHKPDLQLLEDESEVEQYDQQEGWELIPIQGKYIGIHTSLLDEKSNAIELLSVYAAELGADFYPYVHEIVNDVILPGLEFYYHEGVRYSAAQAVPHVLTCVQLAVARNNGGNAQQAKNNVAVLELWAPIFKVMLKVLQVDKLVEILAGIYSSIYQCIELIGIDAINVKDLEVLVKDINMALSAYVERVQGRNDEDDAYTEDVEEEDAESADEELIGEISKLIHGLFKTHKQNFLPAFDTLVPMVSTFLASNSADCRQWALCVFDDLIEYTGPVSWKYHELFFNKMVDALVDGDASVRQAASYGIGIAAQHGGDSYAQPTLNTLETLFTIVNVPEARSDDNIHASENTCAAIAKILRKNGHMLGDNLNEAISAWIKTLPIIADDEAAPFPYLFLADLIEQNHPSVVNQIPLIFDNIVQALVHASLQGKSAERVVGVMKQVLSQLPQDQVMQMFQKLPAESQQVVQKWFQ